MNNLEDFVEMAILAATDVYGYEDGRLAMFELNLRRSLMIKYCSNTMKSTEKQVLLG